MNSVFNLNAILHRPSRRTSRVALSAAYSRVDKRKQATADSSLLSFSSLPLAPLPVPITSLSSVVPSVSGTNNSATDLLPVACIPPQHLVDCRHKRPLFGPRCPISIAAFNVRTLRQIGQQAALARTLDSLNIDVCCVSETRIHDSHAVVELTAPDVSSRYWLHASGDANAETTGQAGVGIVLSSKAASSLVDWIPLNSRLCAARLMTSTKVSARSNARRCLFVVATYAPTDCSPDSAKDAFYHDLSTLLRSASSSDIVLVAGDLNAQVGRLSSSEAQLGGMYGLDSVRTDNGERLLQLCADHRLFLSSTAFRHKGRQCATWRPPVADQRWTQIDHVAISFRWRGSILDCRSFWSTYVDSDHALVRCRFSLQFSGKRSKRSPRLAAERLLQPTIRQAYQDALSAKLSANHCDEDIHSRWNSISAAMHDSGSSTCGVVHRQRTGHWISERSVDLLETRRKIPAGSEHNASRRAIRRDLKRSLRADKEAWWTQRAQEMEEAGLAGNFRKLFQLIRSTGPKQPAVSDVIRDNTGALIHNRSGRLTRWSEHFQEQFSWPPASEPLPSQVAQVEPWSVSLDAPSEHEVRNAITALNRFRAAGPDSLVPSLFKDGGELLCRELTNMFERVWSEETVPVNWGESIVVPIYKKGDRTICANHRGISLTPVVTKLLASILVRRLTAERESRMREEQAGFRPGRGCIDHIFTLRQVLELRHTYRRPTIAVFLDFKSAFDSVDRSVLFDILARKGVPMKYVNILRALYSNTSGRVRVYGELSDTFPTISGVRQGCPISPFLFNFVVDSIMECSLTESDDCGIEMLPGGRLSDLDYADDIVLLFDNQGAAQSTLDKLSSVVPCFGMCFAPPKCKVLLQDHQPLARPLTLDDEELEIVDKFTYLGSSIDNDGRVTTEVRSRIAKARIAFMNLRHLWRQKGISLGLKGRVYKTTVRAVLLYGSETWPLRAEDLRRLQVFDHRCLRSIAGVGWHQRVRNDEVRRRVLGVGQTNSLHEQIMMNKLRWLGHVLRMPAHRLPRRALFSLSDRGWRRVPGGQALTWRREMKSLTTRLGVVGASRLPGWGPRDSPSSWLETLQDMARDRHQWRVCCRLLAGLPV